MAGRFGLVALIVSVVAVSAHPALSQSSTAARRNALWLEAVRKHQPGRFDDSVRAIADWSRTDLIQAAGHARDEVTGGQLAFKDLLARAALLHADIAILSRRDDGGYNLPSSGQTSNATHDGQLVGTQAGTVHWDVARVLLSEVRPKPAEDERVRIWYRATSACFQFWRDFTELEPNLTFGLQLFPDEPWLLLYAGTMHESYATPRIQNAEPAFTVAAPRSTSSGPNLQASSRGRTRLGSATSELKGAERFFRDALAADPTLAEAHIRLGNVLGLRDRHADAVRELQTALKAPLTQELRYMALIFSGREHAALGEIETARSEFQLAVSLYPGAQSPRLGLSQLWRDEGNPSEALKALQLLELTPITTRRDDPWWEYERLHASTVPELIGELRRRLR